LLKLLKAFEKSTLMFIKFTLIIILFAVFYLFFMGESDELRRSINRVSAITSSTFLVVCYAMMRIYGGFCIGKKRSKEIALSMSLAVLMTDVFTYIQLCIMEKRVMKPEILVAVYLVHVVVILVLTKLANDIFYKINPPKKLLIIHDNEERLFTVLSKLKYYQNRFKVEKVMQWGEPELHRSIRAANSVMLIELPVEAKEYICEYCYKRNKEIFFTPSMADIVVNNSEHDLVDDISLFCFESKGLTLEQRIIKRAFDLALSIPAVIIALPIMLAEAVAIKLEDGGPIFYRQERATIGGKLFEVLKFRTMVVDAEKHEGAVLAAKNDSRITKVGAFLRKTRLDELPQLLNIIKGDMSIVGPRPERKALAEEYEKDLPEFGYRLRVKAGLTGLAQIMGKYNTTPKDKLVLDLMYIEKYSIKLDLKIMFQTIVTCLTPEKTEGV
jgi:exopolysaccharide biosynthesis polyprenyl glycosylphosphotransferase